MPKIYLSPSTQEYNEFINGGSEEYHMNLLADALEPYLIASGIEFDRNTPEMTARSSIEQANSIGGQDLYLALHSNASPEEFAGMLQGPDVYYNPARPESRRAAELIADELRKIYPQPQLVDVRPTNYLGEVLRPNAPAVLVEVAYHDNPEDAAWIVDNTNLIAQALSNAVDEFLGIAQPTSAPAENSETVPASANVSEAPDNAENAENPHGGATYRRINPRFNRGYN